MGKFKRNVSARDRLMELATRPQGVTRQQVIDSGLIKMSPGGIDTLLRELRSRGWLTYRAELMQRAAGIRNNGTVNRPIRVYRPTPKGLAYPYQANKSDARSHPGSSDNQAVDPIVATSDTASDPCW